MREFRQMMPITDNWAYFDHAAVGPLPKPTAERISTWSRQATEQGDTVWPEWNRDVQQTRRTAARLINAQPGEVALVNSTTHGIGLVAEGFPWQAGDNVVTLANEFPSNIYPWMNLANRGVETRLVQPGPDGRPELASVLDACDDRTRIVSASWIGFVNGYRLDLAQWVEAVHSKGPLFFLDGIQGVGVFPLDVTSIPIDFLAADGHKWMLGPEGAGIFYLRSEHLELLRPIGVGWNSVVHCFDFDHVQLDLKPTAARFEGGTMNTVGFLALGTSLELLSQQGLSHHSSAIAERICELGGYALQELQGIGAHIQSHREPGHESGIISFQLGDADHQAVRNACLAGGVVLSHRGGCLRISPHAYNERSEVDRLIEILKKRNT